MVGKPPLPSVTNRLAKSTLPSSSPTGGIRMSLTNEPTTVVKAAPITMPTARSTMLPRMMKVLNSLSMSRLLKLGRSPLGDQIPSEREVRQS